MTRRAAGERAATVTALARLTTTADAPSGPEDEPGGTHPAYNRMVARAEFCRRAAMGTEGFRNAYELSLPRLGGEGDESYFFRHGMVASDNPMERTVDAVVGFLNEQAITLEKDADPALVEFITDVDRAGTAMSIYDEEIDYDAAIDAVAVGLVEHTTVDNPGDRTEQEEDLAGDGPYWVKYKVEDVLKPKYKTVNGVRTLVQVTFREVVTKDKGRFGSEQVTKFRVYENDHGRVTCQVWTQQSDGTKKADSAPLPITNQTEIPCAVLPYGRRLGKFEWKPAFLDLAYLAEEHYQLKNATRNLQIVGCVPTRFRVGAKRVDKHGKPDDTGKYPPMPLGVREVVEIPFPPQGVNVPSQLIGWDSPNTDIVAPNMASLTELRAEMGSAGADFLAPQTRAAETATARKIDSSAKRASIHSCAARKQDFHDKMIYFTANFLGVKACKCVVNTNFTGEGVDPALLQVYVTMYINGAISLEALLYAAKNGKLPETFDAEDEAADLIAEQIERDRQAQEDAVKLAKAQPAKPTVPVAGAVV